MKKFITIFTILYLLGSLVNIKANTTKTGKSFNPPVSLYDQLILTPWSSRVDVEVLSTLINGTSSEYPLYISEINSGLIYCVDIKSKKNIIVSREFYFSKHDSTSGEWTKPINIVKEYSKFREENKIMNYDEIFITMDDDIYSVNLNNDFYNPQKININTKNIECNPSLSPDGNTLYFVSNRSGGYGGKDIWAAERLSNGKWSMPYNLGKDINTAENEESPFIMPDGATLCFSSIGHNSYGGYDIFTATQNDEGLWSAPENLGAPVNSAYDDYNFIINSEGVNAYYSSNKMEKSNQNIYFVRYHLDK
ncbi:MAG TPA: hypothetical protein PKK00_01290 [Bacteroidales bacterium]|nr:hypothetical protein [Bacteroidales bacterium]HPS16048.1 hypothetical protein [Bacteroidales bacterium]